MDGMPPIEVARSLTYGVSQTATSMNRSVKIAVGSGENYSYQRKAHANLISTPTKRLTSAIFLESESLKSFETLSMAGVNLSRAQTFAS